MNEPPKARSNWKTVGIVMAAVFVGISALGAIFGDPAKMKPAQTSTAAETLTPEDRLNRCTKQMRHYQELGVWRAGGVKPLVQRSAWNELTSREQDEIFQAAGCIATDGQSREIMVTVANDNTFKTEIETRRVTVK